ncbi:MAG: DUF1956 domain-containing protein [Phycisphaeraceae bacterium]
MSRPETDSTPQRLLEAAVALFAEQGYRRTTVRAICDKAGANVSAVKYHFGDKARLYDAALDYARQRSNRTNPYVLMDANRDFYAGQTPDRRLYLFIRMLLDHMFRDGRPTELTRLMSHEMMHPTPALDRLVEVSARRVHQNLIRIILDLMEQPNERRARQLALSISGLCHFHHMAQPMIERLCPNQQYDSVSLDRLAEHIHRISLAAIRDASVPD